MCPLVVCVKLESILQGWAFPQCAQTVLPVPSTLVWGAQIHWSVFYARQENMQQRLVPAKARAKIVRQDHLLQHVDCPTVHYVKLENIYHLKDPIQVNVKVVWWVRFTVD